MGYQYRLEISCCPDIKSVICGIGFACDIAVDKCHHIACALAEAGHIDISGCTVGIGDDIVAPVALEYLTGL